MENSYKMDKQLKYRELLSQIEVFANAEDKAISVLSNCAAVMKMVFPKEYFWVGFYIVDGNELVLGPFQGTPACTRIKHGRGVCGTAWKEGRSIVVGEIDIDSTELSTFDDMDREYLEKTAEIIAPFMARLATV